MVGHHLWMKTEYDFQLLQAENYYSKHSSTGDIQLLNCDLYADEELLINIFCGEA